MAACEPWCRAVVAALGPGAADAGAGAGAGGSGGGDSGDGDGLPALVRGFIELASLALWVFSILGVVPPPLLAATVNHEGDMVRALLPALLDLAEAAQAVAGAAPRASLAFLEDGAARVSMVVVAAAAVRLLGSVTGDNLGAAAVLVDGSRPGALAALARLSLLEPPLLAGGGSGAARQAARGVFPHHCKLRVSALHTLNSLVDAAAADAPVAAVLAAAPALAAALGAAVGATPAERRLGRGEVGTFIVMRRYLATRVLTCVAGGALEAADAGRGGDISWLRALAT